MSAAELVRHAGKAGYRWAWQYVHDLEPEHALAVSGRQHLVRGLQRPRVTLRYMGGGLDALTADADLAQIEKYRVAAVLAYWKAVVAIAAKNARMAWAMLQRGERFVMPH